MQRIHSPGADGAIGQSHPERQPTFALSHFRTFALLSLAGCVGTGKQDVLAPAGPQSARIADWFWVSFVLAAAVFAAFCAILFYGLIRSHRRARRGEGNELSEPTGRSLVLWGGLAVPTLILLALLVYSSYTDRRISRLGRAQGAAVTIEVVGEQFWWDVRYRDPLNPHREFRTANEIHVPAGRPVRLILRSRDVIHSFWVPNLHGKMDLIPGRTNDLVFQVDEAGVYRGQCAEFCGTQHARMGMLVEAHDPRAFQAWWDRQVRPQTGAPADTLAARGQQVFLRNGCGLCHSVRGTDAHGSVAPDLTHFASRRTIAAGTLPNTRGHLGGWISDPQSVKPGNRMPAVPLKGDELRALLHYLHSLE